MGDIKGENEGIYVKGRIEDKKRTKMLVNTGASVTIISSQFHQILKDNVKPKSTQYSGRY